MIATSQELVENSIGNLNDARRQLKKFAKAHSKKYDSQTRTLIQAKLSDLLTTLTNIDADQIVKNGSATLEQCQYLDVETSKFANQAKALAKRTDKIAKSVSWVTGGLNAACKLARGDVLGAGLLIYDTLKS